MRSIAIIAALGLAACSTEPGSVTVNNFWPGDPDQTDDTGVSDPDMVGDTDDTSDSDVPTDTGAPVIEDVPENLPEAVRMDFRWNLSTPNVELEPLAEGVYMGTFDLTYEGDEPVWTRDLVFPVWGREGAVGPFAQENFRSFFNECELVVDGTVFATGGIQDAETLTFDDVYLTVTESMSFDVFCSTTTAEMDIQLQFALDVPEDVEFTNEVDANAEVEVTVGDRNGGAYPSYWLEMAWNPYADCAWMTYSTTVGEFETTIDPRLVLQVPSSIWNWSFGSQFSIEIDDHGCSPEFEVIQVGLQFHEEVRDGISFATPDIFTGQVMDVEVNGVAVQHPHFRAMPVSYRTQFPESTWGNSYMQYTLSSEIVNQGLPTVELPSYGGVTVEYRTTTETFEPLWQSIEDWAYSQDSDIGDVYAGSVAVTVSASARVLDIESGNTFWISTNQQVISMNYNVEIMD